MRSDSYLRKSTADAGKSVTRQEKDWQLDCGANGFDVGRSFIDPDLSASRYARRPRPDYAELVAHINAGHCGMLSMWESSRGSRRMAEWVVLLDLCRDHGVLIRIFGGSRPETFDPRKQRDREALLQDGIAAERESETVSDRSKAGARSLAYSGKPPGPLLYGYTRTYNARGKFVSQDIEPVAAARVRQLARDTLRGRSLNSQASELNDAGIPSPGGGTWRGGHIARLLTNPGYVGRRVHQGEVVANGVWEPLLTDRQHAELTALLRTPGRRISVDSNLAAMLSGGARCEPCGRVLRTQRGHSATAQRRYVCRWRGCMKTSATIGDMDREVKALIIGRLRQPEAAGIFAPKQDSARLAEAERELAELRAHLASFVDMARARKLTAASLAEVEAGVAPQIAEAERRVSSLSMPSPLAGYEPLDVADRFDSFTPAIQREFVIALADVVLSPCGIGGRWSIWRLARSRWVGGTKTWGQIWSE